MATFVHTSLNFNSVNKITGLAQGTASGEAVTYEQLSAVSSGLGWKDNVRAASTANITLSSPGTTIDGVTMAANDRFLAKNQTAAAENGIYVFNGSASAATRAADCATGTSLVSAIVVADEGTANAGTAWRQTAVNITLGTTSIVWASFAAAAPSASETTPGVIEIATQAETDTGTDDARAITPLKLTSWSGRKLKYTALIGNGADTTFTLTHNLNTRQLVVQVYRNSTSYDTVFADIARPTVNSVTISFTTAPTSNQYEVVILA